MVREGGWCRVGKWRPALGLVILLSVALLGCGAEGETVETAAVPADGGAPVAIVDRIVFVNDSGELFTVDRDGSDLHAITPGPQETPVQRPGALAQAGDWETFYTWPAWSPDGTKIAATRVQRRDGRNTFGIVVVEVETNRTSTAFAEESGGLVARTAPHYMYWSPDGRYLAFIAVTSEGLALFAKDAESLEPAIRVLQEPPVYFGWVADSRSLVAHHGEDILLVNAPFDASPQRMLTVPGPFRAPALSPDGPRYAYIREDAQDSTRGAVVVASVDDPQNGVDLVAVEGFATVSWAPAGGNIAVVDRLTRESTAFQRLRVVVADGGEPRTVAEDNIAAFFWSPTGEEIAWVGVDFEEGRFRWMVSGLTGEPAKVLMHFQPSTAVITMLSYFDQFAYSNSPWSPDGTRLVFAGTREPASGRQNGQAPGGNRVYVLDTTGVAPPLDIAGGSLAFWSWN